MNYINYINHMNIKKLFLPFIVMLLLDFVYLSSTGWFFSNMIKKIQGTPIKLNIPGLIITYLVIFICYYYFIIKKNGSIFDAFMLGFTTYGIYEMTNFTIINKWNWKAVILDTLWGGILFGSTRYLTK